MAPWKTRQHDAGAVVCAAFGCFHHQLLGRQTHSLTREIDQPSVSNSANMTSLDATKSSFDEKISLNVSAQLGLTDAIRYVIGNYGKPITPVEVRDQLLRWYCKHDDYRNLLASVPVMKRVERAGEITFDGTRAVWTGGSPPPPLIGYFPSRRNCHKQ